VTGDDLIVAAPWLAFGAGLAMIGWRLAADRRRRRSPRPDGPDGPVARNGCRRDGSGMKNERDLGGPGA
jgi:hypothetical protein